MHDTGLEERLRSVLRQEGDGVPFTITTDELERRLLLRRRARNGQRLSLLAAGFAALAIGAIFAFGSGLLGNRNVAVEPSPSPTASPDPSASGDALALLPVLERDPASVDHYMAEDPGTPGDNDTDLTNRELDDVRVDAREAGIKVACIGDTAFLTWGVDPDPTTVASERVVCDGTVQSFRFDLSGHQPMHNQTLVLKATPRTAFRLLIDTFGVIRAPRPADPLGTATQAILVTPIGETGIDSQKPDAFDVTRFDPATGESVVLATIPGSVIPEDGWLDATGAPEISATGFLAIPFNKGPNLDEYGPAIAIVDIQAPDAEPWIIEGYTSMAWDETDKLVVERDGILSTAWPMSREIITFAVQGPPLYISSDGIAVQEGARFVATTSDEAQTWGYVGFDGAFTPTTDLPPIYQRSGMERPAGARAHGIGEACDSGPDAASSGCFLIESDADHEPFATWLTFDNGPTLYDHAWGADGKGVWMLLLGGAATEETSMQALMYAQAPGLTIELARVEFPRHLQPAMLGIAGESSPGSAAIVAIGDSRGAAHAFVLEDGSVVEQEGTAWFAGWAGDQAPYDPD